MILGLYNAYMGIMEKKMETTIMGYIGYFVQGFGVWGGGYGLVLGFRD